MSASDQDQVIGRLTRERIELQREKSAISADLEVFSRRLRDLSDKIMTDRYHAFVLVSSLDMVKLTGLLDDFARADKALADCGRSLREMGITSD